MSCRSHSERLPGGSDEEGCAVEGGLQESTSSSSESGVARIEILRPVVGMSSKNQSLSKQRVWVVPASLNGEGVETHFEC